MTEENPNTSIDIHIDSYHWSKKYLDNGNKIYTLIIDGKKVLETNEFTNIDKEIRKYLRLRFKEYVK